MTVHVEIVSECIAIYKAIDSQVRLACLDRSVAVKLHIRYVIRVPVVAAKIDGRLHRRVAVRAGACDLEAIGRGAAVVDLSVPVEACARLDCDERFVRAPRAAVRALLEPSGVRHRPARVRLVRLRAQERARAVLDELHLASEGQRLVLNGLAARNVEVQLAAADRVRDRTVARRVREREGMSREVDRRIYRRRTGHWIESDLLADDRSRRKRAASYVHGKLTVHPVV